MKIKLIKRQVVGQNKKIVLEENRVFDVAAYCYANGMKQFLVQIPYDGHDGNIEPSDTLLLPIEKEFNYWWLQETVCITIPNYDNIINLETL